MVKAFAEGRPASDFFNDAATAASGLRVPKSYGDYIVLDIVRKSRGTAIAVSDKEIFAALEDWARHEGFLLSPEGAAAAAAYTKLVSDGWIRDFDRVLLFNTGSALKYVDVIAANLKHKRPPQRAAAVNVGGIISPM